MSSLNAPERVAVAPGCAPSVQGCESCDTRRAAFELTLDGTVFRLCQSCVLPEDARTAALLAERVDQPRQPCRTACPLRRPPGRGRRERPRLRLPRPLHHPTGPGSRGTRPAIIDVHAAKVAKSGIIAASDGSDDVICARTC